MRTGAAIAAWKDWENAEADDSSDSDGGSKSQCLPPTAELRINGLAGYICSFAVDAECPRTVRSIKKTVHSRSGIPWSQQRLIRGTSELRDIEQVVFEPGSVVDISLVRRDPQAAQLLEHVEQGHIASLRRAPPALLADREFMLSLTEINWEAFHYAANSLASDRSFFLEAFRVDGRAIAKASPELRADREAVLAAVKSSPAVYANIHPELQADHTIGLAAAAQDGMVLFYMPPEMCEHRGIALAAVQQCGAALMRVAPALRDDRDIVLAAVLQDGNALEHASSRLCGDRCIVRAAVELSPTVLRFASPELQADPELLALAARC